MTRDEEEPKIIIWKGWKNKTGHAKKKKVEFQVEYNLPNKFVDAFV